MADLTTSEPPAGDLTRAEEQKLATLYAMCEKGQRFLLLEMFERRAHKCLRIGSFEEYCRERLGFTHDKSYLSRLVSAARVERSITGKKLYLSQLSEIEPPKISLRAAAEIAKLPEDKWARVYEEYQLRDKHGNRTPADLLTELKRIVKRESPQAETPAAQPVAPVEEARVRHDMTPVVPAVYDGTPEQVAAESEQEDADAHGRPDEEENEAPTAPAIPEKPVSANPLRIDVAPPRAPDKTQVPQTFVCTTVESDPVLDEALSFLRRFTALFLEPDQTATHELFREVKKFLKAYGP